MKMSSLCTFWACFDKWTSVD